MDHREPWCAAGHRDREPAGTGGERKGSAIGSRGPGGSEDDAGESKEAATTTAGFTAVSSGARLKQGGHCPPAFLPKSFGIEFLANAPDFNVGHGGDGSHKTEKHDQESHRDLSRLGARPTSQS